MTPRPAPTGTMTTAVWTSVKKISSSDFAQGKMWYSMGEDVDPAKYIQFYASEGRRIRGQELDLTPPARLALRDFLQWNIQPDHAGYAYDYYLDNCSTRIRDALDRVLGGAIGRYGAHPSGFTWRDETRRLDQHNRCCTVASCSAWDGR